MTFKFGNMINILLHIIKENDHQAFSKTFKRSSNACLILENTFSTDANDHNRSWLIESFGGIGNDVMNPFNANCDNN